MENPELALFLSGLLSMVFEFVPFLRDKWEALTETQRGYLTGLMLAALSIALAVYQCYGDAGVCPENWINAIAEILVVVVVGNQGTYRFVSKPYRQYRIMKALAVSD